MSIETFVWRIQANSQPTISSKDNIRKVQFSDGYTQVSGSGLNDEQLIFSFAFSGNIDTAMDIHAFLRRHKTKSFAFKPPFGELTLWRVQGDSLQYSVVSKTIVNVTATFEQAFNP